MSNRNVLPGLMNGTVSLPPKQSRTQVATPKVESHSLVQQSTQPRATTSGLTRTQVVQRQAQSQSSPPRASATAQYGDYKAKQSVASHGTARERVQPLKRQAEVYQEKSQSQYAKTKHEIDNRKPKEDKNYDVYSRGKSFQTQSSPAASHIKTSSKKDMDAPKPNDSDEEVLKYDVPSNGGTHIFNDEDDAEFGGEEDDAIFASIHEPLTQQVVYQKQEQERAVPTQKYYGEEMDQANVSSYDAHCEPELRQGTVKNRAYNQAEMDNGGNEHEEEGFALPRSETGTVEGDASIKGRDDNDAFKASNDQIVAGILKDLVDVQTSVRSVFNKAVQLSHMSC